MAEADALRDAGVASRLPAATEVALSPNPPPLTPAPAAAPPAEEKVMTLVDHLSELRRRIFICIAAVIAGSAVGFYYSGQIVSLLKAPLPPNADGTPRPLNFLSPGEAFFIYIKLA